MLSQIGRLPDHLVKRYSENHPLVNKPLERDLGAAFAGLALVMEYLALLVRDKASKESEIPVELSAIEVPPQQRGREMISLDITEYGDLLNTRLIRVPFSGYLKPWQKSGILNDEIWRKIPQMVTVPLFEMDLKEGIETMRDQRKAIELASRASASIPDQSRQMLNLIRAYQCSPEAEYHNWYYSVKQEVPSRWPHTYDLFQAESLPPCIRFILQNPNDFLETCRDQAGGQNATFSRMASGAYRRTDQVKYERDYGWAGSGISMMRQPGLNSTPVPLLPLSGAAVMIWGTLIVNQ